MAERQANVPGGGWVNAASNGQSRNAPGTNWLQEDAAAAPAGGRISKLAGYGGGLVGPGGIVGPGGLAA